MDMRLNYRYIFMNNRSKKDLGTTEFPAVETPLIDGEIAFKQHTSGHTPVPNWPTFIKFADGYLSK